MPGGGTMHAHRGLVLSCAPLLLLHPAIALPPYWLVCAFEAVGILT